jgi:hypothetical protein
MQGSLMFVVGHSFDPYRRGAEVVRHQPDPHKRRSIVSRGHRRRLTAALTTLITAAAAVAVAAPAHAGLAFPLPNGSAYIFSTPNPPQLNTFVTTSDYWSVVGIEAPTGTRYGLNVNTSSGTPLASSSQGALSWQPTVDFVAVNNNSGYSPIGTYQAVTSTVSGSGNYEMEYSNPLRVLSTSEPFVNQPISMGPGEFITTSDVYLTAGQKYRFDMGFFQRTVPSDDFAAAYLMSSTSRAASAEQALWLCTADFGCSYQGWTAPQSGWYALVIVMVGRSSTDNPTVAVDACSLIPASEC